MSIPRLGAIPQLARLLLSIVGLCLLIGLSHRAPAVVRAQNPTPTAFFISVTPGATTVPSGATGVGVYALGAFGGCQNGYGDPVQTMEASAEYYISHSIYTWVSISPQSAGEPNSPQ